MRTEDFVNLPEAPAGTSPVPPEDDDFATYSQLKPQHGIDYSRVHLRRLIRAGLFPAPLQLSPGRLAWRVSALRAWKASRPVAASARPVAAVR